MEGGELTARKVCHEGWKSLGSQVAPAGQSLHMSKPDSSGSITHGTHSSLTDHEGILRANTHPDQHQVELDYDPSRISPDEMHSLLHEHINRVESHLRKETYRLNSHACEACALKLDRKLVDIPGVRRATATYAGKVLSITYDSDARPSQEVESGVRKAGARIEPLPTKALIIRPLMERIRKGELNNELSCLQGLIFMIAALGATWMDAAPTLINGLYLGAYLFAGQEGVRSALASLRQKVLDIDVLMVLAALGAAWIGHPFEGALLLFLFSLSNVLQDHAMERTQRAIESLLTLRPSSALVRKGKETVEVAVEEIEPGQIVIVRPGEQIPVDGILREGSTYVDECSLTGESMPVEKEPGSPLFAGTLNKSGGIELKVSKRAEDTTLARMVKLVAEAQAEKSQAQRFMERAEQYYAMGVILFTIGVLLVPWLMQWDDFGPAFYRAMTVMVVASPCALVISTPATVLSAIGGAARQGILIKGGSHLERAAHIDIVAIDKTGTLTMGKPEVTSIVTADGRELLGEGLSSTGRKWLAIAAGIEAKSEHPLAQAICTSAKQVKLDIPDAISFQSEAGKGAEATIGHTRYIIGSERHFHSHGATGIEALTQHAKLLQEEGQTCVWLGSHNKSGVVVHAVISMADTLRPAARELIHTLHELGVKRVVMLTGDQNRVAKTIAGQTGVDEFRAELLPNDKLVVIRELKQEGRVMMVGDGVNDAPALAIADLGVAMGAAGTDVAMETADVILMGDQLDNIPLLLSHTRRAKRVLKQNLSFAGAAIVLLVAATLGFSLALPLGVVGHEGSTVLVCLNGLRLLRLRSSLEPRA